MASGTPASLPGPPPPPPPPPPGVAPRGKPPYPPAGVKPPPPPPPPSTISAMIAKATPSPVKHVAAAPAVPPLPPPTAPTTPSITTSAPAAEKPGGLLSRCSRSSRTSSAALPIIETFDEEDDEEDEASVEEEPPPPPPPPPSKQSSGGCSPNSPSPRKRKTRRELKMERAAERQRLRRQKSAELKAKVEKEKLRQKEREAEKDSRPSFKPGATVSKRQATKRATVVFLNDPTMSETLEELRASDAASADALAAATAEEDMLSIPNSAGTTLETLDATELQQLRGIFAAHDEDHDGLLTDAELQEALRALGFIPNDDLMRKYYLERAKRDQDTLPHPSLAKSKSQKRRSVATFRIDLATFMAAAVHLDSAESAYDEIAPLWADSDSSGTGEIGVDELKRLLCRVAAPTRLSLQELDELFESAELLQGKQHDRLASVRYEDLVESLLFA